MARYFFDLRDGDERLHDAEGQTFPNESDARGALIHALCDIARETLPDGDHHVFSSALQDEHGRVLYVGTLTFDGRWTARED